MIDLAIYTEIRKISPDYMGQIEAWAQDQFPGWTFDYERAAA